MFSFNYFNKYDKEDLEYLLEDLYSFQSWQAIGLFLTKATWLIAIINNMWNANMSIINKFVFGALFSEHPFTVYLFKELGFNIGFTYTNLMISMSIFVFIMGGLFSLVETMVDDIQLAIDAKEQEENKNE